LPSGADDLWTITVLSSGLLIGFGSQEDSMTEHRARERHPHAQARVLSRRLAKRLFEQNHELASGFARPVKPVSTIQGPGVHSARQ
jgi:hypothetical protein